MNLSPAQIALQLGIAGLLVVVGYRIALVLIKNWRETESERTTALANGLSAITTSVNNHSSADIASHERLVAAHNELAKSVVRVEAKLDTIAELTPVTPIPKRSATPATGVSAGYYGPRRPKTSGEGG
jgi:hypothetical protein